MSPEQQDLFSAQPSHSGPVYVPFVRSSATSRAAAEKIRPKLQVRERQVLAQIKSWGPSGNTDNAGIASGVVHANSWRARRVSLVEKGFVVSVGVKDGSNLWAWTGKEEPDL